MTAEPTKSDRMAGMESDADSISMEFREQEGNCSDERRENEQEDVIRGNKSTKATRHKRTTKKKGTLQDGTESEERGDEDIDPKAELFNIVVHFVEVDEEI